MDESTTKDGQPVQKHRYNKMVIDKLSAEHGLSVTFIRQCLRGDRNSLTADRIRKEYKVLLLNIENALNSGLHNKG